jgi:hypothetical protein
MKSARSLIIISLSAIWISCSTSNFNELIDRESQAYLNESGLISDVLYDGILNGSPNNELDGVVKSGGTSYGNIALISGQAASDVFVSGYDIYDLTTWAIKGNGPADRDNSGGYSIGDIAADSSTVGFCLIYANY